MEIRELERAPLVVWQLAKRGQDTRSALRRLGVEQWIGISPLRGGIIQRQINSLSCTHAEPIQSSAPPNCNDPRANGPARGVERPRALPDLPERLFHHILRLG